MQNSNSNSSSNPETAAPANPLDPVQVLELESRVLEKVRTVYDPEIPINIYELGLIYELKVEPSGQVHIKMTLTAPACPEAELIPIRVESAVKEVDGITGAQVELVWDPPWTPNRMSEAAKLQLGIF